MRPFVLASVLAVISLGGVIAQAPSPKTRAESEFQRGLAWLHSFMYEDAIDAFRAAQKIDPTFVLAYWGEAMSFSQPLWFFEELDKGRAALAKLGTTPADRMAKAKTAREQGYLRAVEALFGAGDTRARAAAHAREVARVAAEHPGDDDALAFYALALLATMPRGDAALPIRQQAGAIAEKVFARNPKHPGAPHYILHAYDHGTLAAKALDAARAYA
ncbi:MAG TPA: tetratricopeptide repeat protein, partial [Vicinamibacterales bacterium]|nr:tetratricopeptide repeat protein [Vicinamibacterales bacterium]